jgi:hypothetical protein
LERVVALKELLNSVVLSLEEDVWKWAPEVNGDFSVKSAYKLLVKELEPEGVENNASSSVFG